MQKPITILGDESLGGAYLLRVEVQETAVLPFGRFRGGKLIEIPAGKCVYVGSAMKGLGRRLVRHASRTEFHKPHPIQAQMLTQFVKTGLLREKERPFPPKRLHWNIDHLLELDSVVLTHVIVLRSHERLETAVAQWLMQQSETFIIEPGLGANDVPGNTHLLGVKAENTWWLALQGKLAAFFDGG